MLKIQTRLRKKCLLLIIDDRLEVYSMAKNLQRTFGWVQNPGELCKLRTVVASLCSGTNERTALIQTKFPLLKHNGFISDEDYTDFIDELSKDSYSYAKLKGKAGKTRGTALCTGIIQAILDAQKLITIKDLNDNTIITNKPYSDDWTFRRFYQL